MNELNSFFGALIIVLGVTVISVILVTVSKLILIPGHLYDLKWRMKKFVHNTYSRTIVVYYLIRLKRKKVRMKIYEMALDDYMNNEESIVLGLCTVLSWNTTKFFKLNSIKKWKEYVSIEIGIVLHSKKIEGVFTELKKYKPKDAENLWWPTDKDGRQKRISVLKEILGR